MVVDDSATGVVAGYRRAGVAAKYCLDARAQFAQIERLGDIVVGTQLEPHDPIDHIVGGGKHHNRYIAARADTAGNVESAFARQVDVKNDQVRHTVVEMFVQLATICRGFDDIAVAAQIFHDHGAQVGFIINQHKALSAGHRGSSRLPLP